MSLLAVVGFEPTTVQASQGESLESEDISDLVDVFCGIDVLVYGQYVNSFGLSPNMGECGPFDLLSLDQTADYNARFFAQYDLGVGILEGTRVNLQLEFSYSCADKYLSDDLAFSYVCYGEDDVPVAITSSVWSYVSVGNNIVFTCSFLAPCDFTFIDFYGYFNAHKEFPNSGFVTACFSVGNSVVFLDAYTPSVPDEPSDSEFEDEQLQLTNNIFENIKIIGLYIANLPLRIVSGLGEWFQDVIDSFGGFITGLGDRINGFFTNLGNQIGGYFTSLGNQIGGYFNNLARDIAIAVAEVFGWDDYQEGDSGLNDIYDKIVGSLPDLSAYVPRAGTLLGDVFGILFSNDTVAVFLKIVTVVGVGSFLIFK